MFKRAAEKPATPDARVLDAYAVRGDNVPWDVVDGRVVIALPKRHSRIEAFLARFVPGPDIVLMTLDAMGSAAWRAADGTRTVRDVGASLREAFGADAEPADARATRFFEDLVRRNLARLFEAPRPARDAARGFTEERGFRSLTCRKCARAHPMRAVSGARYLCPSCRALNRVP